MVQDCRDGRELGRKIGDDDQGGGQPQAVHRDALSCRYRAAIDQEFTAGDGGFDYFTDKLQALMGIDDTRSNKLEIVDGVLTGHLLDQDWGDICDGEEKKRMLQSTSAKLGINASQCIAVGDGSNDLPMMQWCGLSVAYKAKPKVRQQANIAIDSGGLDRMLELIQP